MQVTQMKFELRFPVANFEQLTITPSTDPIFLIKSILTKIFFLNFLRVRQISCVYYLKNTDINTQHENSHPQDNPLVHTLTDT